MKPTSRPSFAYPVTGCLQGTEHVQKKMNVSNACVCQKSARGKDKVLSCDVCFIKYHISCLQLSNDLVKVLTDTSVKVPWTCNRCKSNIKELTAENNRLNDENSVLRKLNETLTNRLDSIDDHLKTLKSELKREILAEINDTNANHPVSNSAVTDRQISEIVREINLKESKRMNLCVSGLPKTSLDTNDVSVFAEVVEKNLGVASKTVQNGIVEARRVGQESAGNPQLLVVTFKTSELRQEILKNSKKLKEYRTSSGKKNFIFPDYTPNERDANKKLVDELKERRGRNESVMIKKGKIVQIRSEQTD